MNIFFNWRRWIVGEKKIFWIKSIIALKQHNYEPFYNKIILKTEIKFYTDETTDFHDE